MLLSVSLPSCVPPSLLSTCSAATVIHSIHSSQAKNAAFEAAHEFEHAAQAAEHAAQAAELVIVLGQGM